MRIIWSVVAGAIVGSIPAGGAVILLALITPESLLVPMALVVLALGMGFGAYACVQDELRKHRY